MRITSFSITRNQKNRRKKNTQLIMACPLGNSQSLESQSGLYSAIRNRLTTQSKPDLRYVLFLLEIRTWITICIPFVIIRNYTCRINIICKHFNSRTSLLVGKQIHWYVRLPSEHPFHTPLFTH